MAETPTNPSADSEFDSHLRQLREQVLRMAGTVEEMIADSVRAWRNGDEAQARTIVEADKTVNRLELEADEHCMAILARWQPMASDLRFVTLVMKMVTDLERIGDLAVNICERAIHNKGAPQLHTSEDIPKMAEIAQTMVRDAIDAFVAADADKALAVIERDDAVDKLYTEVFRATLEIMLSDSSAVEDGIHIQSVAKWLERMADHATNLSEQVIFLAKGKDIRHGDKIR